MARAQVLFASRGPAVFRNVRRTLRNTPRLVLHEDATETLTLDLTSYLESGETISSATVAATNVTCTASVSSPTVTLTISGPQGSGDIDLTITLSSGSVWAGTIETDELTAASRPSRYS